MLSTRNMLKFLLLEDDPVDCELIETTLRRGGIACEVVRISQRQSFLENLETRPLPDLILADYILPHFDGITALKVVKAKCPDVPFILVSGILGEEQAIDALKHGATDYVLKQRLGRLVPAVQRAVRESQERQERLRVAAALRQTDDLLRTIVEASPVGIITLSREGLILTWNAAAERLYGWSAETVVGRPSPLIPASQRESFDRCFQQALQNRQVLSQEGQQLTQRGDLIDIGYSLASLHDADNCIYGVVMTAADITLRKQIEAQQQILLARESEARAAAESASRIKDEFLAILSHELRTPLNAIMGWMQLIQGGKLEPPILQRALDIIERNAAAQAQLIEDLLDLSRIIRGKIRLSTQPVDPVVLIYGVVDTLRPAIDAKSIQLELALPRDNGKILADPNRLQQVLWNLLSNAIKFTPA